MKKFLQTFLFMLVVSFVICKTTWGQPRPTTEERLIRLEEGIRNLEKDWKLWINVWTN